MTQPENSLVMDLVARAKNGDDTARDELFSQCRNYVGVVARAQVESWMRTKVDASDLVQQTLLEAHRGIDAFRGTTEAEWLAWLRKILAHNTTDFMRQYRGTAKRAVDREVSMYRPTPSRSRRTAIEPSDGGESPSFAALRHERELAVAEAVAALPDDYREVIMLRNLQRLSFNEIAERMDRTRPAAQMLWLRALRRLEQQLADTQ